MFFHDTDTVFGEVRYRSEVGRACSRSTCWWYRKNEAFLRVVVVAEGHVAGEFYVLFDYSPFTGVVLLHQAELGVVLHVLRELDLRVIRSEFPVDTALEELLFAWPHPRDEVVTPIDKEVVQLLWRQMARMELLFPSAVRRTLFRGGSRALASRGDRALSSRVLFRPLDAVQTSLAHVHRARWQDKSWGILPTFRPPNSMSPMMLGSRLVTTSVLSIIIVSRS